MMTIDPGSVIFSLILVGALFAVLGWLPPSAQDRRNGYEDFSPYTKGFGRGGCAVLVGMILTILIWWCIVHLDINVL